MVLNFIKYNYINMFVKFIWISMLIFLFENDVKKIYFEIVFNEDFDKIIVCFM